MSVNDLLTYENCYPSEMGGAFIGERAVMHGRDILNDLGHLSWLELVFFAATGFEGDREKIAIISYVWTGCSYPDPRLWNNRVAALAGSTRSTASLAVAAGVALSEATIYGHRANVRAIDFMIRAQQAVEKGVELEQFLIDEIDSGRRIYGYGRPISGTDERNKPTMERINRLDPASIPHTRLSLEIEEKLVAMKGLKMNITAISAAMAADAGFTPRQYHAFMTPLFIGGMVPCYLDASKKPEGCVFPVRCNNINYTGTTTIRQWGSPD